MHAPMTTRCDQKAIDVENSGVSDLPAPPAQDTGSPGPIFQLCAGDALDDSGAQIADIAHSV